jgi:hypothetical protein
MPHWAISSSLPRFEREHCDNGYQICFTDQLSPSFLESPPIPQSPSYMLCLCMSIKTWCHHIQCHCVKRISFFFLNLLVCCVCVCVCVYTEARRHHFHIIPYLSLRKTFYFFFLVSLFLLISLFLCVVYVYKSPMPLLLHHSIVIT